MRIDNLVMKVLFQKRLLLFWWFIAFVAITTLTMSFFPAFKHGGLGDSLANLPAGVQSILGSAASFLTPGGYVQQQIFALRAPLLCIILSIVVFGGQIAGEEQKGVTETHLTLPISRTKLLMSKLVAGLIITFIASMGIVLGVELGLFFINESYSFSKVMQSAIGSWLIGLVFGLITYFVGAATGRKAPALGLSGGLAFWSYLISSMAASVSWLQGLNKFTPFYYYSDGLISTGHALGLALVCLILVVVGTAAFNHRDLRT